MSLIRVRPMAGLGAVRAAALADCTQLLSLAAGAAGAPVLEASGAVGGGDLRAAGGSCTPAVRVAPRRPNCGGGPDFSGTPPCLPHVGRIGRPGLAGHRDLPADVATAQIFAVGRGGSPALTSSPSWHGSDNRHPGPDRHAGAKEETR